MVNIAFGVTGYGPMWPPAVASWLRCVAVTSRQLSVSLVGKMGAAGITDRMYTAGAQNRLVQDMLDMPDATHLFLTEVDMLLPDDAILRLLEVGKPMVSGVYFLRHSWGQPCLYKQIARRAQRKVTEPEYAHSPVSLFPQEAPFLLGDLRSSGVPGLGCVLIERLVFEAMEPPWFQIKEGAYGSDMYFFKRACAAGFEVWVDPTVACRQVDYYVTGIDDYHDRLATDPSFGGMGYIIGQMRP